jgi:hypothetical protein
VGRVLTASRVEIDPGEEAEYLEAVRGWREALRAGGRRCWVFRRRDEPGTFLEFVEGPGPEDPRAGVAPELGSRVRALGRRLGDGELWDETT